MTKFSISKALYLVLVIQIVVSVMTVALDIEYRWLRYFDQTELRYGPIEPGDQRRLFEPKKSKPEIFPSEIERVIELPDEMPARLMFEVVELEGIGSTVFIYGEIEVGDFARLKNYYSSLSSPPKNVTFNSPGGSVYESLEIGKFIREQEMQSIMLPGNYCFSACPYMFAAGSSRIVYESSALGMHQHYFNESVLLPTFMAVKDIQIGQGQTMLYLMKMNVSPSLMVYSLNTPPDEIYVLVEEELLETKLATEFVK